MSDILSQTLSTSELPGRHRIDRWTAFGSETLSDMTVDPYDRDTFQARLSRRQIGNFGFIWMDSTAATARRRSSNMGHWASPGGDAFLLTVQDSGESAAEQDGRQGVMRPGDMILRGHNKPWLTRFLSPVSTVTIKIPLTSLLSRLGDPERLTGEIISGGSGPAKLAAAVIRAVKRSLEESPDEAWDDAVTDVILDSLSIACRSIQFPFEAQRTCAAARSKMLSGVFRYIDAHLDDPQLSSTSIASTLGVSLRSLQRMFVETGQTPRHYILNRRLDHAARRLKRETALDGASVTEIAYATGFNELSYFSRSFHQRFGLSPRQYRAKSQG